MAPDILIGVDAGTSVIKSVAFTAGGEQIAMASRPNSYQTPGPGHVEQDMPRTFADCAATLRDLGSLVPDLAKRTIALAVTGQGDGTWLIDRDGEPVGGGLLWLDSRAAGLVADYMQTDAYPAHYQSTGSGLNACMASGQIAWMQAHQPERLARATTAFHCKDWLYFKLTGERVTDPAEANFTFGNFRTRAYQPSIMAGMGIGGHAHLLPPVVEGTRTTHPLSAAAAGQTGLAAGLPVVLGYLDVVCTAIGGGISGGPGTVGISILGSTGMHMRYVPQADQVRLNADRSGYTMCVPVDGACAAMQSNMAATLNIDWLLDRAVEAAAFAGATASRASLLAGMDERVLAAKPAEAVFHPYIFEAGERGPFLDPNARAQFSGLSTSTSLAGLFRSIYEGLAMASRDCYTATGLLPGEVRLGGGAARSKAMRAIMAAALNRPVRTLRREELGASGAVMMAAVAMGLYRDMGACVNAWVTPVLGGVTAPDETLSKTYDGLYPVYRNIREAMPPSWQQLAALRRGSAA